MPNKIPCIHPSYLDLPNRRTIATQIRAASPDIGARRIPYSQDDLSLACNAAGVASRELNVMAEGCRMSKVASQRDNTSTHLAMRR